MGRLNQKTWRENLECFRVFKPFLSDKGVRFDQDIKLKIKGDTVKDQIKVTEILADHFATIADRIGGTAADLGDLDYFTNHPSIRLKEQKSTGCDKFHF